MGRSLGRLGMVGNVGLGRPGISGRGGSSVFGRIGKSGFGKVGISGNGGSSGNGGNSGLGNIVSSRFRASAKNVWPLNDIKVTNKVGRIKDGNW